MKLIFKRDGKVHVGSRLVGMVMRSRYGWEYRWGGKMIALSSSKLIRELNLDDDFEEVKLNDLKAKIRKAFTVSKMKKMAAQCDLIEMRDALHAPQSRDLHNQLKGEP